MRKLLFLLAVVLGSVTVLRLLPAERRARLRKRPSGIHIEGEEVQA